MAAYILLVGRAFKIGVPSWLKNLNADICEKFAKTTSLFNNFRIKGALINTIGKYWT